MSGAQIKDWIGERVHVMFVGDWRNWPFKTAWLVLLGVEGPMVCLREARPDTGAGIWVNLSQIEQIGLADR